MKTVDTVHDVEAHEPATILESTWVPRVAGTVGVLGLLFAQVLPGTFLISVICMLIGAGGVLTAALCLPRGPGWLLLPHVAVVLFLLVQGLGLCKQTCGNFGVYDAIGSISTLAAGLLLHASCALFMLGWLRNWYQTWPQVRILCVICQGISAFFALRLVLGQHWCPACIASHLMMLAQAIMLVRLTDHRPTQRLLGVTALSAALGINALFHHQGSPIQLEPGDRLLGLVRQAQDDGSFVQVRVAESAPKPTSTRAAQTVQTGVTGTAPTTPPDAHRALESATLLVTAKPARLTDFTCWGTGPQEIIASMSLVCPHCRDHWAHRTLMAQTVNAGKARIRFLMTWPLTPEPHHGARLASQVVYAAGMLGEDELIHSLDRFFSADGLVFLNAVNAQLLAASSHGSIPKAIEQEALVACLDFASEHDAARLAGVFTSQKPRIDAYFGEQVAWLVSHGDLHTPHYYFVADHALGTYLDTSDLDPEVWSAFINK